ncbi:hypothetical protein Z051_03825 [Rhodococcus rhodochrous KG-21]|uniref:Uncharacterized protein n=1 Tax=Rhodococcus rhodochrous KG-21 TaxID=1441923 RepID=A0A0M8PSE1_RHORH|nr:hypothetical protein Z051_03825 [Rhodococcus rhodochrous KG-21]
MLKRDEHRDFDLAEALRYLPAEEFGSLCKTMGGDGSGSDEKVLQRRNVTLVAKLLVDKIVESGRRKKKAADPVFLDCVENRRGVEAIMEVDGSSSDYGQ